MVKTSQVSGTCEVFEQLMSTDLTILYTQHFTKCRAKGTCYNLHQIDWFSLPTKTFAMMGYGGGLHSVNLKENLVKGALLFFIFVFLASQAEAQAGVLGVWQAALAPTSTITSKPTETSPPTNTIEPVCSRKVMYTCKDFKTGRKAQA